MYKRILVPTDGSAVAEAAVDNAIELARAFGSEMVAVCVAVPEPLLQSVEGAMIHDPGLLTEELLEHARRDVEAVAARARQANVPCTPVACSAPDAADAIVDTALQHHCDLIIMGSHGRRGIGRLLGGSVTQAVLAHAPAPVMVLRPAKGDHASALHAPGPSRSQAAAGPG